MAGLSAVGSPSAHMFVSANLNGGTNFAAAGLGWTFGDRLYLRPGIGIAVHDGPLRTFRNGKRTDLGSRVLFEPELAAGWKLSDRFITELSWVHLSHATLFSDQNPGLNSWGIRLLYTLPKR